jgi:hypothetical protein
MTNPFASAIAKAAQAAPMSAVPIVPNRVLLVDGDGLAYYCAGNDETGAGEARDRLVTKVRNAASLVGAERIVVLLTKSGSHKGHRYAIARVKPYQGQRSSAKRPANWGMLRDFMLSADFPFQIDATAVAEADDLFGWYCYNQPDNVVLLTQDKDMRMLPGLHLDWVTNRQHKVTYTLRQDRDNLRMFNISVDNSEFNEKQYGPRWFWLQMLHGDTADNIPGLPKYQDTGGKLKPVGEVTAGKLIAGETDLPAIVATCYRSYYGERWLVEMLEQACLLWMRRNPEAWDDCINVGGPMARFNDGSEEFAKAYAEIEQRVRQADDINAAAQAV